MTETDHIIAMIAALTALVTAVTALVTAVGTAILSWRQQKQIDNNSIHVAEHIAVCPLKVTKSEVP